MPTTVDNLLDEVCQAARNELEDALRTIKHCVNQLTEDQLWWRPSESMNSIANLLLHLCGNVRQWIVSGVGGAPNTRERQREFDQRDPIPKSDLMQQIEGVLTEAKTVLSTVTADELLRIRRIQGNDVTGMQAVFHSVSHFRGHTQEIAHMTRCQLANSYEFYLVVPEAIDEDDE